MGRSGNPRKRAGLGDEVVKTLCPGCHEIEVELSNEVWACHMCMSTVKRKQREFNRGSSEPMGAHWSERKRERDGTA